MSEDRHLLIVDDDDRIRNLLKEFLARAGFRVTGAADAAAARRVVAVIDFDLMILDVMMPGEDGLSLTRWLRAEPGPKAQTPILMLTARGMADDRIQGLTVGVDDYMAKPFEPQELVLRIEAILRRAASARPTPPARLSLGVCAFDVARGELTRQLAPVRLTEGESKLLRRLAAQPHQPVDRMELALDAEGGGRGVDVQVTRLRRKIETDPRNPRYLQTVRGVGYMLAPDDA
ncbi:MAG TPA: response regulator [Caulobacteraceae bacterium]|nr:response regulator [Caulobacteraceae bacterium]